MTQRDLSEVLQQGREPVEVEVPPIPEVVAGAGRQRRRRTVAVAFGSAAAVIAVIGGAALLSSPAGPGDPGPSVAAGNGLVAPPGTRLVALGHAAIAVPTQWGTNKTRCGVPMRDTVVIDVGATPACGTTRPRDVDSVEIWQGQPRFDYEVDDTTEIDGVRAERQKTACEPGGFGGGTVCAGTIYLPSLGVTFRAESSTSSAEVDRILEWIRIVPDEVGVPGFQVIALNRQGGARAKYVEVLREAGLGAEVRTRKVPAVAPGYILAVSPAPGTLLRPGEVVTVTVVADPAGPADEVGVGMSSVDSDDEYDTVTDGEIRSGATIKLRVGDRIWAYANGKRAGTLAGELNGTSLTIEDWEEGPNYPHSWQAVSPGRTKVTLTITGDGEPVILGVVTVAVS